MKEKNIIFVSLVVAALVLIVVFKTEQQSQISQIDCSKPLDVIYITHEELKYASEIANKINGVVVIPEDNQLIARTEILNCLNFDYNNYINIEYPFG